MKEVEVSNALRKRLVQILRDEIDHDPGEGVDLLDAYATAIQDETLALYHGGRVCGHCFGWGHWDAILKSEYPQMKFMKVKCPKCKGTGRKP